MYMTCNVYKCLQCTELRSVGLLSSNDYIDQSSLRECVFSLK